MIFDRIRRKKGNVPESLGNIRVFIRNGDFIREVKGKIGKNGEIVADNKTWIVENVKPYLMTKNRNSRPVLFLDANKQVEYRFPKIVDEASMRGDIVGQTVSPRLLKKFSDSVVVEKLAAAKVDKTMMILVFVAGMFVLMLLQQFIPHLTGAGTGSGP